MLDPRSLYLRSMMLKREEVPSFRRYPFNLPAVHEFASLSFREPVTFIVGENGSGKSTLLEAMAVAWGDGPLHYYQKNDEQPRADAGHFAGGGELRAIHNHSDLMLSTFNTTTKYSDNKKAAINRSKGTCRIAACFISMSLIYAFTPNTATLHSSEQKD
ncbi:AAA family ATPase [Paenibacillus sp.]|uniref:AAA family ATPase n=1 Tax=Paenibacillus sp. TaxID=58172 RepID=UPI00283A5CE6|nr:AAA family ATPase [Paenibacillus sp.]MDR0270256.1 AAA family ATPase [Paenibacillus sp.]